MANQKITFNSKGLFLAGETNTPIAPPIRVEAAVQVEGCDDRFARLQFRDEHGKGVRALLSRAELDSAQALRKFLLNKGYVAPRDPEQWKLVADHLASTRPSKNLLIVNRVGWHGASFVVPGREFKTDNGFLEFAPQSIAHVSDFIQQGSLESWQREVASTAAYSARLVFAISYALAAPLLPFSDVESGMVHFEGQSSKGKTTLLIVARSVFGNAKRGRLTTWDITKAGLEELAMGHNHCLLCLDEIARLDDNPTKAIKLARHAAFMLAGGKGRIRSVAYGQKVGMPRDAEWQLLCLSNGETAINDMASTAKVARLKGEQVRLIDIPALANNQLGIFDKLPDGVQTPAELAEALEKACQQHHGVALAAWTTSLATVKGTLPNRIEALIAEFNTLAGVPRGLGWERRFAKRFALTYAAGMLGIELGLLPWESLLVAQSITTCYIAARSLVPDADKLVTEGMAIFKRNLKEDRIIRLRPDEVVTAAMLHNRDGFRRTNGKETHFFLRPSAFTRWFRNELQAQLVLQHLAGRGLLERPTDRPLMTVQTRVQGLPRCRYYKVRVPKPKAASKPKVALRPKAASIRSGTN